MKKKQIIGKLSLKTKDLSALDATAQGHVKGGEPNSYTPCSDGYGCTLAGGCPGSIQQTCGQNTCLSCQGTCNQYTCLHDINTNC